MTASVNQIRDSRISSLVSLLAEEPQGEEVHQLDEAEEGEAHAEAQQATDVGEKVEDAVQEVTLLAHEVELPKRNLLGVVSLRHVLI